MNTNRAGATAERKSKALLESQGYLVVRAGGSLGPADLVALKRGEVPMLLEVKRTRTPYAHFLPADRKAMTDVAHKAGAEPVLAYWRPRARTHELITADRWP